MLCWTIFWFEEAISLVFRTTAQAAAHVAEELANTRAARVCVQLISRPASMEEFSGLIFTSRPELIACVDRMTASTLFLGAWYELVFQVTYTQTMISAVSLLRGTDTLLDRLLRDASLHRRHSELVFPNHLEASVREVIGQITRHPRFLNCFVRGVGTTVRRRRGCDYCAIQVQYLYSCDYAEFRLRSAQMQQATREILQFARAEGPEDWKKAFRVVKYCVDHWRYGTVAGLPDVEYTCYGALVHHRAVCMGISLAICSLFSQLGIPCRYITGQRNGNGHGWNLVYLRGGWFYIDVTDAICRKDPFFHWGMTSFDDRTVSTSVSEPLRCTCPVSFLRMNAAG